MPLDRLIEALSDPRAYPHDVDAVAIHQTHISVVFLAGPFAYKIKKPVDLGFVDYSSLEKRRHFCEREVVLNRRLAPEVYLGVVPVTSDGRSGLKVEGDGPTIEWAVKMVRLPEQATLGAWLERQEHATSMIEKVARRVAAFHARAASGPDISAFGRFEVVARNARENFEQSEWQVHEDLISRNVFDRLRERTEATLARHRALIDDRAGRDVPRDTHGDLRLDHVYLFPDRAPPGDLVIVDCIEFNDRFRHADPVSDVAFPVMDLTWLGRRDLAERFAEAYFEASGDHDGRALLPYYVAYRATVRAKVEGMKAVEPEIADDDRAQARTEAQAHWLLALGALEEPDRRPCLLLVGGLPGVGKSTLARGLVHAAGFQLIRTDEVRKELAAASGQQPTVSGFEQGLYTPAWTGRIYAECLARAKRLLFEGRRVLIDATFRDEDQRRAFLDAATRWGVPGRMLVCQAAPEVVRHRIARRTGDASDADWAIHQQTARLWQPAGAATQRVATTIDTGDSPENALRQALAVLKDGGLM